MSSSKKGLLSMTNLFLAVQIAQIEIRNKVCQGKSEKRLEGMLLEDMVLIQDAMLFEE